MRNNKVIYTCLTGTYDELRQPLAISPDFDYVCFSDSLPAGRNGVWDVRPIPYKTRDKVLRSRFPKLQPHKVLPEYDYSIYMDANVQITAPAFYEYVNQKIMLGSRVAQVPHLVRNCVYQELYTCWYMGLISLLANICLRHKLHRIKMPENYGLMENNLILRRHNDPLVITISDAWWRNYRCGWVKRDQLLLMPIYWKYDFMPDLLFGEGKNVRNVEFVMWMPHKMKRVIPAPPSGLKLYLMRISNGAERRGWF